MFENVCAITADTTGIAGMDSMIDNNVSNDTTEVGNMFTLDYWKVTNGISFNKTTNRSTRDNFKHN